MATILVVDRKVSLVMELRDDSTKTFDEAIGLSTYSNKMHFIRKFSLKKVRDTLSQNQLKMRRS